MSRRRRLALVAFATFVVVSAVLHFTVGSTIATYFPNWRYEPLPDQAISIISLSHAVRERVEPPTPSPTAPPKIVLRTASHVAPLKYRELTHLDRVALSSIRAPARKANLYIIGPHRPKPGVVDAPAASNAVEPTPSPRPAGARVDTGGLSEEANASVWGDDNPPRVLHAAPINIAGTPPKPVRIIVEVGPDGNVISVKLLESSGDAALDQQALDAGSKSVFAPATLNGLPVHGSVILIYPATSGSS